MHEMKALLKAATVMTVITVALWSAVAGVRWAKRGGTAASLMASALILGLGMGVVVKPPLQGVEQAQEEADKSDGSESGDPPAA
jgi:hypothetical protein